MNRTEYYNYIDEKLHILANRIISGGKLNILSLHMHSENFYLHFFNLLYSYELNNLNNSLQNIEAIDLIDCKNKMVIQVSSTSTKRKIESSLGKEIIKQYPGFTFKFISIAKDTSRLRKQKFLNPHDIFFNPSEDIHDIPSILKIILSSDIDRQKEIYKFIKKELGNEIDIVKLDSNLARVINVLAKERWENNNEDSSIGFEIERKIVYNNLNAAKDIIKDYSLYHTRVDEKYSEFDSLGHNKSASVLATIKREYLKLNGSINGDDIFFAVIGKLKNRILNSSNYVEIPIDELELCIDILVVDAFIRCKILKKPEGYNHATS